MPYRGPKQVVPAVLPSIYQERASTAGALPTIRPLDSFLEMNEQRARPGTTAGKIRTMPIDAKTRASTGMQGSGSGPIIRPGTTATSRTRSRKSGQPRPHTSHEGRSLANRRRDRHSNRGRSGDGPVRNARTAGRKSRRKKVEKQWNEAVPVAASRTSRRKRRGRKGKRSRQRITKEEKGSVESSERPESESGAAVGAGGGGQSIPACGCAACYR